MSTSVTSVPTTQPYQPKPHQDNAPSWQALLSGTAGSSTSANNNGASIVAADEDRYTGGASPRHELSRHRCPCDRETRWRTIPTVSGSAPWVMTCTCSPVADGALGRSELMQAFNISQQ